MRFNIERVRAIVLLIHNMSSVVIFNIASKVGAGLCREWSDFDKRIEMFCGFNRIVFDYFFVVQLNGVNLTE